VKAAARTLHVLTGCTATGKTAWALRRAEELGAEIISCDSLLFYRGMDIGTAKPAPAERARVPHHLIDICEPAEPMNVARYVGLARAAAEGIRARGREVMVVGGSGFYLKAFFSPVADDVTVPADIRARVAAQLAAEGLPALVAELRRLNPAGWEALDTANPRRVTRALERCLASGRTWRELAADFAGRPAPFADWRIELTRLELPPAELDRRIAERAGAMLRAGLVDEVRALRAAGFEKNPSAARAIGYREVLGWLDGGLKAADLEAKIIAATRQLVKKQRTWFRTQLPAHAAVNSG
jgi:tRNA dimethylallyltransferase